MSGSPRVGIVGFALAAGLAASLCATAADAAPAMVGGMEALADTETLGPPVQPRSSETRRLFVNFDGGVLTHGDRDDATRNITRAAAIAGELQPYGGSTLDRMAILQAVRADFEPYNVAVTSNRPESGDYVMAVVGPNRPEGEYWANLLGTAFLDCWDAQTFNDISFAFHGAQDEREASEIARTASS